jgi:Holliday junction resolvasome RuvABC DNA-binding subunit
MDQRELLDMPSLIEIEGVGPSLAAACVKTNYRTIAKIAAATTKELASVPGISEKNAPQIIASAKSLLPGSRVQKAPARKKQRAVAPVKVVTKATTTKPKTKPKAKTKTTAKLTDKAKGKPDRKSSKKPSVKTSETGKKMSGSDAKDKIKKLKKKIKKLREEKKKILKKENKKLKKEKAKKSGKKSSKKK